MSEQDNEVLETINSSEEQELELNLEDDTEDVEALKAEMAKKDEILRAYSIRAKKAEAELKALKTPEVAEATHSNSTNTLTEEAVEVKILKAQGMSEELITQLKKIARVNETSVIDAQSDPYFQAYKKQLEEDKEKAKASLGASKGSSSVRKSKDFSSQGLSDEEHKQLWRDRMGL